MKRTLGSSKQSIAKRPRISQDSENQRMAEEKAVTKLPKLPTELELQILTLAVIPQQPCIQHTFGKCMDEWSCKQHLNHSTPLFIPDPTLTSICKTWRHDALKYFFTHNAFVFNNELNLRIPPLEANEPLLSQEQRDVYATRLLDFIDRPDWKDVGSRLFRHNFSFPQNDEINLYRHLIRTLVLVNFNAVNAGDWDWMLKVDWQTLPRLETLYLDLNWTRDWGYTGIALASRSLVDEPSIKDGAERMKCLNLKKLVLVNVDMNLPWNAYLKTEDEKRRLRNLFKCALGPGGEVEIRVDDDKEW